MADLTNHGEPVAPPERSVSWYQTYKGILPEQTKFEFEQKIREEFCEMLVSIKTYGGFYIGRYETGNPRSKTPVVKKSVQINGSVCWAQMYKTCKNIKNANHNTQTGMIWGILWDETLKWLIDSGEKSNSDIYNSRQWGNYSDYPERYTSGPVPTGTYVGCKANNIFDLAGNQQEACMLMVSSDHYARGGGAYQTRHVGSQRLHCQNTIPAMALIGAIYHMDTNIRISRVELAYTYKQ